MKLVETIKGLTSDNKKEMTQVLKYQIIFSVILGLASFATFITKDARTGGFFEAANLIRLVLYGLFLTSLLLVFRSVSEIKLGKNYLPGWTKKLVIILPLVAVVFAIINAFFPLVSEFVRMSDTDIFQRPGAMLRVILELSSCVIFLTLIPHFIKQKNWKAVGLLGLLALIVFLMAGEELSWGQRIFHWQTSNYFAQRNEQNETNLHDTHTQFFQNNLFFGGFLLLVVLPFFHDQFARLFKKTKSLGFVVNFLPESWMILAFGAGLMFVDPFDATYGLHWTSITFQLLATLVLLTAMTVRLRRNNSPLFPASLRTLICAVIVLTLSLSFDALWNINEGLPTEYIKMFVCFGILCWAIRTRQRTLHPAA
jgi:hypothetical protein